MAKQQEYDEFCKSVAEELKARGRKLLYTQSRWWEYKAGAWSTMSTTQIDALDTMIHRLAGPRNFPFSAEYAAFWRTMRVMLGSEDVIEFDAKPMLVTPSGTYFLKEKAVKKWNPKHYATRVIDVDVNGDADCPEWLAMLDRIFEDHSKEFQVEAVHFLQEWMGLAIVGGGARPLRKGLIMYGDTSTAKSLCGNVLTKLLGSDRVVSISMDNLSRRFGLETAINASAIVSNEGASPKTEADSSILKRLITGEPINVDRKNKEAVEFQFRGPVLFTTNVLPKVKDETNALYDRFVVLEMTRQFTPDEAVKTFGKHGDPMKFLADKKEFAGILNWALAGYERAIERGILRVPSGAATATEKFRRQNDVVYDFIRSCCVFDEKTVNPSGLLAACVVEYASQQHDVKMSPKHAASSVAKELRSALPGVTVGRVTYKDKTQQRSFTGVRLNKEGMAYADAALARNGVGVKEHMRRMNEKRL